MAAQADLESSASRSPTRLSTSSPASLWYRSGRYRPTSGERASGSPSSRRSSSASRSSRPLRIPPGVWSSRRATCCSRGERGSRARRYDGSSAGRAGSSGSFSSPAAGVAHGSARAELAVGAGGRSGRRPEGSGCTAPPGAASPARSRTDEIDRRVAQLAAPFGQDQDVAGRQRVRQPRRS